MIYEYQEKTCNNFVSYLFENMKTIYCKKKKLYYVKAGCGFDIETTKIYDTKGNLIASYPYHWQFSFDTHIITGRYLSEFSEFITILSDKIKEFENLRIIVWVANLGFEWQYCKKHFFPIGISHYFCKEVRDPLTFLIGDCIEFRECLGLFGESLDDIAKSYTDVRKKKGDLDYNQIILSKTHMTEEEKGYCYRDVEILSKLGNYVFGKYFGKNPDLPLTSTGLIRNKIKKKIGKKLKKVMEQTQRELPPEEDFYFLREYGFKGGICGTNIRYLKDTVENVICADLTSDYPAQMLHQKFPMGFCVEVDPEEFLKDDVPYIAEVVFCNLKAKTSHSLYSASKAVNHKNLHESNCILDNNRIQFAREAIFVVTDAEMQGFNKAYDYDDVKVLRCWRFTKYEYLPSYVTSVIKEQYLKKAVLKKTGKKDTDEYNQAKVFVNGIFGMFATSVFPFEKELIAGDPDCTVRESENRKSFEDVTKSMFLSPFWAFWVCSYARNILIDAITKFPDLILQYDTDSLYFKKDGSDELVSYLENHNARIEKINAEIEPDPLFRDLGCWEIEKPYKRFKGLGAKRYILEKESGEVKTVVAGCRKGTIQEEMLSQEIPIEEIFHFFDNDMVISEKNSKKLASSYIDKEVDLWYTDRDGNMEFLEIKSCVILKEIPFHMGLAESHLDFYNDYTKFRKLAQNSNLIEICKKRGIRYDYLFQHAMDLDEVKE